MNISIGFVRILSDVLCACSNIDPRDEGEKKHWKMRLLRRLEREGVCRLHMHPKRWDEELPTSGTVIDGRCI